MRLPRFTIRSLLGAILFAGIAIAALRASTDAWDFGILGLSLLILLTAVLLAVHRTDGRRDYWLGFALFGWTYLIASLIPPIGSRLPTTIGLAFIDSKIPGRQKNLGTWDLIFTRPAGSNPVQAVAFSPQGDTLVSSTQGVVRLWDVTTGKLVPGPGSTTENFIHIGHSLLALLLAFIGGQLSRCLYGQRRGESVLSPRDSPTST